MGCLWANAEIFGASTEVSKAVRQRKHEMLKKSQEDLIRQQQQEQKHRKNEKGIEEAQEEQRQEDSENSLQVVEFMIFSAFLGAEIWFLY